MHVNLSKEATRTANEVKSAPRYEIPHAIIVCRRRNLACSDGGMSRAFNDRSTQLGEYLSLHVEIDVIFLPQPTHDG